MINRGCSRDALAAPLREIECERMGLKTTPETTVHVLKIADKLLKMKDSA